VPDTTLVTVLANAGVAGVVLVLFLMGVIYPKIVVEDLRAERDALRQAVMAERDRADAAVSAAQATRDVFAALRAGMDLRGGAAREADHQGQGSGERGLP
jgi:hypothetical protein